MPSLTNMLFSSPANRFMLHFFYNESKLSWILLCHKSTGHDITTELIIHLMRGEIFLEVRKAKGEL